MRKFIQLFAGMFLLPSISNPNDHPESGTVFFKKTRIIFSLLLILCAYNGNSQAISNYSFASSSGTFTNIVNGILPGAGGGTADEGYGNAIPIGFDFWYMGIKYTTVSASSNGWLTPGSNIINATPINNLSAGVQRPVLAPLWDDLDGQSTGNTTYVTTGVAGSRVFTIQYLSSKWSRTATAGTISFQVKLYEGTGKIEFIYRPETGTVNAASASIGISGTGTGSGNFLSLNGTGTLPAVSSSTETVTLNTKPASGQTYSFTPPIPVAPVNLNFTNVSVNTMTLNWQDNSGNESGFAIYRSTDGINYSFVSQTAANAVSSVQSGLTANTNYYWKLFAVTEGGVSNAVINSQATPCASSPASPTITSPLNYCQNATAVQLTATGTNLLWGGAQGSVGGTNNLVTTAFIDGSYNNRKVNFTTNSNNVIINSVDYFIPSYQAVNGLLLSIYNSSGTVIATAASSTTLTAGASQIKITNTFNYNLAAAGNYSIGVSAGTGNIGSDNPTFPITEPSGTIMITGLSSAGSRCFNNIQFTIGANATAPTPSTAAVGSTSYYVTQTVSGCISAPASININVTGAPVISQIPVSNLIGNYKFQGNANDASATNNGTLQNAPLLTADRFGNINKAYSFNGSTQYISTAQQYTNPVNFSISIWFKTATTTGGKLIGFGSGQTGASGQYDRHIYMTNAGQLYFGVYPGSVKTVNSALSYNDNNWHLVTATLSSDNGMILYIDGSQVAADPSTIAGENYTGYWRIGYDNVNSWTSQPTSFYFNGILDDALIYHRALSSSEVLTLYTSPDGAANNGPVCAGSTLGLTAATISGAAYSWTGPNGFTSVLQNPSFAYSAANAGVYTLQVTGAGCTSAAYTNVVSTTGTGQWTGIISTDWANAGNWCTGVIPTLATNVIINAAAIRMPSINGNAVCNNLTIDAGATLITTAAGTLNIAGILANNGTMSNGGTTNFNGTSGQQTFSGVASFNNLTLNNSSGLLLPAAITINNNLLISSGTLNANNFGITVKGNWTNNASATAFAPGTAIVSFTGTTGQSIGGSFITNFNNLTIANAAGTVTLNTNTAINGDLNISAGTFDLGGFTANRTTTGGVLTVANNAVLKIAGTNTYPANYSTNTLVVASTVEYSGTNQVVSNQLYGNLSLSSSSGIAVKTFPLTALTVVGNLTSFIGVGTSVSYTAGSNITVGGNVSIGISTTFNGAGYTHSIAGNWSNSGTFNGNSSTVIFNGAGSGISGTGIQNFNNLTVSASQIIFSSSTISLSGNLASILSGSFSQAAGGTLFMTGATKTIIGSGISLNNLDISGSVSTGNSLILAGNLSVNGTLTANGGIITMSGISKNISGTGLKSFATLTVSGAVNTAVNFSISSGLSVTGSLTASAGTVTFTGTSSISGTANLFNTIINGTSLKLSAGSVLGIANVMTIASGILNTSSSAPNTVNFNGTAAQDINAVTYSNLVLSNGNTKTARGAITTAFNITIGTGTSFDPLSYTHLIYGNWINNGTFIPGTGTIEFAGPANSYITGATTFNNLTSNTTGSTTELILNNNIAAAVVNMTNGIISTGSNTLTITNTRTGTGYIYGNIQRTHTFTTGVAYAFEGPDNTIVFSAVSSVASVTVSVVQESTGDFPFGGSISRYYNIMVPTGTYNATLRLHYQDDELNGNIESSMGLWNYPGSVWSAAGKTANSTTSNYIEQSGLTNIATRWTCSDNSNVVQWNGSVSTDWNTAANWTILQGSASAPPSVTDIVKLGTVTFNYQPSINTPVNVKNINFGSAKAVSLTLAIGGSLTSGDIRGSWSSNAIHTIKANAQPVTINGDLLLSDGVAGHAINLTIGSGTVTIGGSLNQSGGASIIFSSVGNLKIAGDYNYVNGVFTPGTGTVTYNGLQNQEIGIVNYHNLIINKVSASVAFNYPLTADVLSVIAGEIDNYANTTIRGNVTIAAGAILDNHNILHVGGNWANNGTYTNSAGTNVIFDGTGTQNISSTTFNDFTVNKPVGTSAVLTGNLVLNGDLTITSGTFNIKSFNCNRAVQGGNITLADSATFIVGANNSPLNFSNGTLATSSTVIADGIGSQAIFGVDFGNLIFRNGGLKTLVSPITVKGNLIIETGASFNAGGQTLTLDGNWINGGTFIPTTGTVICTGTAKNISGNTTFNRFTVFGSYTFLNDVTINSLLVINSAASLSGGSTIRTTMNGDLINKGILYTLGTTTFTGNVVQTLSLINAVQTVAITVNFNGTVSPVLNSTSPPQYGYLNINNTGGVNPSVGWTIFNALTVGAGASFNCGLSTHDIYGSVTNNGTITSSGILNFIPSSAVTLNLGTNFSSTGKVIFGGTGAISMAGAPASFHNVQVSNSNPSGVAPSSNWRMTNNFTVNSGSIFNAAGYTYRVGGKISNMGTMNSGTSTFILDSVGIQDIYSPSAFNNLTINKAAGQTTLSSSITVNGVLNFVTGNISTGNNQVRIAAPGSVNGAAKNTGWVNGYLTKHIGAGTAMQQFEIGDDRNFTPVSTNFTTGVITAGELTASTTAGDHPNIGNSGFNTSKTINRYWTLTNSTIDPVEYNATFNFIGPRAGAGDIDAGVDTTKLIVKNYNGNWSSVTTGSKRATSIQATGIHAFGDFQVAELECAPPAIGVITVTNVSCYGNHDGTISMNTVGGTGPFTWLWSNGAVTQNLTGLAPGHYAVTITAPGGCTVSSDTIVVTEPAVLTSPISGGDKTVCFNGDLQQAITATATVTGGGTITWYDASTGGNIVISPTQTGVGTATYYAEASNGSCISSARTAVILRINDAPPAPVSEGDQTVCSNDDDYHALVANVSSDYDLMWYDAASGGNVVSPVLTDVGSVTYYAEASNGTCFSPARTPVTLTINLLLTTPGSISGPANICEMIGSPTATTYSINPVADATFYTWHIPSGTTMLSGQGTTSIQVIFADSFELTHSMFTVTAGSLSACTSAASELEVFKIIPDMPTVINGPVNVCPFIGQPARVVYSIDPVANATSYTWTVSGAAILLSGQGSTSIEVSYLDTFTTGNIKVTANSNCGSRAPRSLTLSALMPGTPSAITGTVNACPYIGTGIPASYSILPVANATSYTWIVPAHVTLVSGQGTPAITVTFNSGYTTSLIKVRSNGDCGSSNDRSVSVITAIGARPGAISGPSNACVFIGTGDEATYTIHRVINAVSYIWTVPAGATITSHPGGTAANDTIITIAFNNNFVTGTRISVQAINCVPGTASFFTISRKLPTKPGLIAGPINVCPFMVSDDNPQGTAAEYSIQKIAGAKSYLWTVPANATITSHPAGTGENDTLIRVIYSRGFVHGNVTVAVVNGCGPGTARTLAISRLVPGTPGNFDIIQTASCPNRVYTYTLAAMPLNTMTMVWTIPANATLVSGQGTTSLTVSYPSGAVTGTVTAKPYNNCSSGTARSVNIKLPACSTANNKTIQGNDKITALTVADAFEVKVFPNPAISSFKVEIVTNGKEEINVRILDMAGNELEKVSTSSNEIFFTGNELRQGIYLIEVIQGKNKSIQKFIKL